jgi:hypothetical protein
MVKSNEHLQKKKKKQILALEVPCSSDSKPKEQGRDCRNGSFEKEEHVAVVELDKMEEKGLEGIRVSKGLELLDRRL